MPKIVNCLYRVSTKRQVDQIENDIPTQRDYCRAYIDRNPEWVLGREFCEKGISGFKVSAKKRDAILELQELAIKQEFQVLLVYMFDRIGRIDDETPFIVEWFVKQGVEVWSVNEGQQRFDNHVDKLTNYIRFWQASGESRKTSTRVRDNMRQLVKDGLFVGGVAPFGYKLVKQGRKNKKGHDVSDLIINEEEKPVVILIFHLHADCGLGPHIIARHLRDLGITTRAGEQFTAASVRNIITNPIYIGMLKFNGELFGPFEHLIIIEAKQFEFSQWLIQQRSKKYEEIRKIPLKPSKHCLLGGNIFCGHCGGRLNTSSSGHIVTDKNGNQIRKRKPRYVCYNRARHKGKCEGQTTYSARIIDNAVLDVVNSILKHLKGVPASKVRNKSCNIELCAIENELTDAKKSLSKCISDGKKLRREIPNALDGNSDFTSDVLMQTLEELENSKELLETRIKELEEKLANSVELEAEIEHQYSEILSWSDILETSDLNSKRMIVLKLVDKVEVSKDYEIVVHLNTTIQKYLEIVGEKNPGSISIKANAA